MLYCFVLFFITSCSRNTFGCNTYKGNNSSKSYKDKNKKVKVYRKAEKFKLYRERGHNPISN